MSRYMITAWHDLARTHAAEARFADDQATAARIKKSLSRDYPGFDITIQESPMGRERNSETLDIVAVRLSEMETTAARVISEAVR